MPKPFEGTNDITVPYNPIPPHILEQVKLTSTLGCIAKISSEKLSLVVDDNMYIQPNPYYTPAFLLKNGMLSMPICYGEPRMAFNMEDEVAEIAEKHLRSKGYIKDVIMEQQKIDYYKKNAKEIFVINGKLVVYIRYLYNRC